MKTATEQTIAEFDSLDDFDAANTANMTVVVNGVLSTWVWTFAGPGHAKTVEQSNRMSRQHLHNSAQQEQARVNGRKWKAPEETPDGKRAENIDYVFERLISWSPVVIAKADYEFSEANVKALLSQPSRMNLLTQALEFLAAEDSFTKRSVKT